MEMTNQTIEEIRKKAEHGANNKSCTNDEYYYIEPLIAANELLQQVVVLEEGAEPMVGDVIESHLSNLYTVTCVGHELTSVNTNTWDIEEIKKNPQGVRRIIQRNGKPVIYQQGTK